MRKLIYKLAVLFLFTALATFYHLAFAQEYIKDETVSPKSVEEAEDAIEYGLEPEEKIFPTLKQFIEGLPKFLQDSTLTPHFRAYSFSRTTDQDSDPDALAIGGEIRFLSGWLLDTYRIGASYYISHGLSENDGELTLLLGSDGSDLNTLGQLYLEATIKDAFLRLYRQSFSLPYVNRQDSRMIPNTHEAYVLAREGAAIDFAVGHVSQIKTRNSEGFISMAEAAGATGKGDGLHMLGVRFNPIEDFDIGAINYYTEDVLNIFYSEFNYSTELTADISAKVSGQFTKQSSVGDELIGDFDTHHLGVRFQADYRNAILTLAASKTGSDAAIRSPFGGRPSYLSLMLQDFDRANENGVLVGLSYDFSSWGLPGLSGFVNYAEGDNAEDPLTGANLPDLSEYDITVDIKPQAGVFNGFWLRLRHARADFDGGAYTKDNRAILNYEIPIQ